MKYMLDTNICIYIIKNKPKQVIEKFSCLDSSEICISSISYAELLYGAEKSRKVERNKLSLAYFLSAITIRDFGQAAAAEYGRIRAELEKEGQPIGAMDMLIAAHAKSEGLILVTNNTREFCRVKSLEVENWVNI